MKKRVHSLEFLGTLAIVLAMPLLGVQLNAQQTNRASGQPQTQQQPTQPTQPTQPPDQPASPDSQAQPQGQQSNGQVFTGTIVKSGDKYVLQDSGSGTTYDIDHQDQVKKFEGKRVRVKGTLDPNGKMIHVQ